MKNIETKCITHAPTLLSHKGSAAWAIALKFLISLLRSYIDDLLSIEELILSIFYDPYFV